MTVTKSLGLDAVSAGRRYVSVCCCMTPLNEENALLFKSEETGREGGENVGDTAPVFVAPRTLLTELIQGFTIRASTRVCIHEIKGFMRQIESVRGRNASSGRDRPDIFICSSSPSDSHNTMIIARLASSQRVLVTRTVASARSTTISVPPFIHSVKQAQPQARQLTVVRSEGMCVQAIGSRVIRDG